MSKNRAKYAKRSYMSIYTKKKKHRYIVTEKNSKMSGYIQDNINEINDCINYHIQILSVKIYDRQLPYIIVENRPIDFGNISFPHDDNRKRIRGIFRNIESKAPMLEMLENYEGQNIKFSHAIEFFAESAFNGLSFSNLHFDVKIASETDAFPYIFADIFMDSAMFNSYSFLKEMNDDEKHEFGKKKFEFYLKKGLPCFYRLDEDDKDQDKILYYSLAFSCRNSEKDFDFDGYISLWNEFVEEYYPRNKHIEKSVEEQIRQYFNPAQVSKKDKNKLARRPEGCYLFLRVNEDHTESLHPRIMSYFGMKEYHIGATKIVDISEYDKIQDMLINRDVSAYKIVKRSSSRN